MTALMLLLHLLGATVWTGGHLVLALAFLPRWLRERDVAALMRFEAGYERLGMSALLIQVITGLWLAWQRLPLLSAWFTPDNPVSRLILAKLTLLALTAVIALHARLRVIPRLSAATMPLMACHIAAITLLAVLFVTVGLSFRVVWF